MVIAFIQNSPIISILLFSLLVTLFITVVNYFMIDKNKMKEIRDRQKELRLEMKKHKDNPEKMMELNKRMMEDMPEQLKHSFKPMLVTMIPILLFFSWLRTTYAATSLASTWIWWYIGSSIVFSIILRKIFGLQ
jgi:uncharacterized membrane protein (DUF106 family)